MDKTIQLVDNKVILSEVPKLLPEKFDFWFVPYSKEVHNKVMEELIVEKFISNN